MRKRSVAANTTKRPEFESIKNDYGEDPARFLCSNMDPRPRIRGITDEGLLNAYLAVERRTRENPRKKVLEAIANRRAEL